MGKKIREETGHHDVTNKDSNSENRQYIEAAMEGDKDAFGKLVLLYQQRLFRFVFMMLGKKDATEDIVQEAFVRGYLALGSFEPEKPFYPWIATIARNLAINKIKAESREKPVSEMEDYVLNVADGAPNPMEAFLNRENDIRFARAVKQLPEQYRTVFVMRMIEKMSYDEIAKTLNISPGTVDSRLFRARRKLVELLKDFI